MDTCAAHILWQHDLGWETASTWLDKHRADVGQQSTYDPAEAFDVAALFDAAESPPGSPSNAERASGRARPKAAAAPRAVPRRGRIQPSA